MRKPVPQLFIPGKWKVEYGDGHQVNAKKREITVPNDDSVRALEYGLLDAAERHLLPRETKLISRDEIAWYNAIAETYVGTRLVERGIDITGLMVKATLSDPVSVTAYKYFQSAALPHLNGEDRKSVV
jgi:hypothetical protein